MRKYQARFGGRVDGKSVSTITRQQLILHPIGALVAGEGPAIFVLADLMVWN
jgi:hypothetical protein